MTCRYLLMVLLKVLYEKYRIGGDYKKAITNLEKFVFYKKKLKSKTPYIQWQFIVNKYKDTQNLKGLDVRKNKDIKGNYIIGDDRALILAGPLKKDEVGFWTVEKEIVEKLNNEFFENWTKSSKLNFE